MIYSNNGYKNLPNPLTEEEFEHYYKEVKLGSVLAREKLIEHNMRHVFQIAYNFQNTSYEFEELVPIGTIGLIKSIDTFEKTKGKFFPYANSCIENEILLFLRSNQKKKNDISLNSVLRVNNDDGELTLEDKMEDTTKDFIKDILDKELHETIWNLLFSLKEKDRKIIELRYGFGGNEPMQQKEVASILNISRFNVSMTERSVCTKMRNALQELELFETPTSLEQDISRRIRHLTVFSKKNKKEV